MTNEIPRKKITLIFFFTFIPFLLILFIFFCFFLFFFSFLKYTSLFQIEFHPQLSFLFQFNTFKTPKIQSLTEFEKLKAFFLFFFSFSLLFLLLSTRYDWKTESFFFPFSQFSSLFFLFLPFLFFYRPDLIWKNWKLFFLSFSPFMSSPPSSHSLLLFISSFSFFHFLIPFSLSGLLSRNLIWTKKFFSLFFHLFPNFLRLWKLEAFSLSFSFIDKVDLKKLELFFSLFSLSSFIYRIWFEKTESFFSLFSPFLLTLLLSPLHLFSFSFFSICFWSFSILFFWSFSNSSLLVFFNSFYLLSLVCLGRYILVLFFSFSILSFFYFFYSFLFLFEH